MDIWSNLALGFATAIEPFNLLVCTFGVTLGTLGAFCLLSYVFASGDAAKTQTTDCRRGNRFGAGLLVLERRMADRWGKR